MPEKTFQLAIHAADHSFYEGPCYYLSIPTPEGQYGIMAHHENTIFAIEPGSLYYRVEKGGDKHLAAVSFGMLKMENNQALVLVNTCEKPEEIDLSRAEREEAETRAALEALEDQEDQREEALLEAKLLRSLNRIKVKKQQGK